jgi:rhizosphere induced protein
MSHLKMNFANKPAKTATALGAAVATNYNLVCTNNSSTDWFFYVYQTMPNQPSDIFSLAWFASPYKISKGSQITFTWSIDYSFVWGNTGAVSPGVTFSAGGSQDCSLTDENQCTFSLNNGAPQLSIPVAGGQAGSLTINQAANVPNGTFSTGIGMSGHGTFVQQALANTGQVYTPTPKYWIAAATQMQMGTVLAQTISQAQEFDFDPNVFTVNASLGQNNKWVIS